MDSPKASNRPSRLVNRRAGTWDRVSTDAHRFSAPRNAIGSVPIWFGRLPSTISRPPRQASGTRGRRGQSRGGAFRRRLARAKCDRGVFRKRSVRRDSRSGGFGKRVAPAEGRSEGLQQRARSRQSGRDGVRSAIAARAPATGLDDAGERSGGPREARKCARAREWTTPERPGPEAGTIPEPDSRWGPCLVASSPRPTSNEGQMRIATACGIAVFLLCSAADARAEELRETVALQLSLAGAPPCRPIRERRPRPAVDLWCGGASVAPSSSGR